MDEATVAQHVLDASARLNVILMRNNVGGGTFVDPRTGRETHLRWGLMNESKRQNEEIKSSDYIGITPVQAYVNGIGWTVLGVFTAIETKQSTWKFNQNDKRAVAQQAFHSIVTGYGGFAGFATGPDDVKRICRR